MRTIEHPFSDLLRHPNQVVGDLADADVIVLRRRDAPALRLSIAERDAARSAAFAMVGRTLRNLAVHSPGAVADAVIEEFPWTSFLPEPDRHELVREFTRVVLAASDVDNFVALGDLLHEWQVTAEIHSDPDLARRLVGSLPAEGSAVSPPSR